MRLAEQVRQELEKVIRDTAEKEGLTVPPYRIEVFPTLEGAADYLIEYIGKSGEPLGLGFRNIRPVTPGDFNDPKFRVRLVHNLALWLKAQAARDFQTFLPNDHELQDLLLARSGDHHVIKTVRQRGSPIVVQAQGQVIDPRR
jgi:hypothetical protein